MFKPFLITILLTLNINISYAEVKTYVDHDLGDERRHGLKYIKDVSLQFVQRENEKHGTHWQIFEPSAKVSVLRCVVPLKTMWLKDDKTYLATKRDIGKVAVSCNKTVDPKYPSWKVQVESTRNK